MAVPRPILLAVLGLLLLFAAFLALGAGARLRGAEPAVEPAPAPTTPSARAPARSGPKPPAGLPAPVARALEARGVVVLLLTDPRAADDRATLESVRDLERRPLPGVAVFRDRLERLGRYRDVLRGLGVSQVPAVVIVGPDRRARVVEGYVDPASLRQRVLDARR
jgi:hypothetical protein